MSNRCAIYVRVSTDDQRDNGYSIDSQLRMIKEYCEKNNYLIVDVYNDAGHSGKDLMRPEMQRLLKDIKSKKIDKLVAIKVDRLTRNNYDGFWLLNYCEEHDVKIELILEPYDVSTANGEMIFGMNLVFGQRERKEIGARTKRAMEEMALSKIHPSKAPYGYIRNKETGHLEIEPIEAQVVKEIFELCKKGHSTRNIASIMKDNNAYLKQGKWRSDRVYKILTNSIYIGIFEYGKYKRKPQDILRVNNYCEPIIDEQTWNVTRANLEKNKHSNYGEHIHLFTSIVKCPDCGGILSSTNSFKNSGTEKEKVYYIPGFKYGIYDFRAAPVYPALAVKKIRSWHLDIIHSQTEMSMGIFARFLARQYGIPLVHTYHTMYKDYTYYVSKNLKYFDMGLKKAVAYFSKFYCDNTANAFIVPTIKIYKLFREEYHYDKDIYIVPTGIDVTTFLSKSINKKKVESLRKKLGYKKNDFVLIFAGRTAQEKNIEF